jgi:hypothetical protein
MGENEDFELHLRVYKDRSEYYPVDGNGEIFPEGPISVEAKRRIKTIRAAFASGFLERLIEDIIASKTQIKTEQISEQANICVTALVDSLTSEVGRALIGLSVMQLCIKSISPEQSIRLHKGSVNRASFSWVEGVSMRTLDKKHVTPVLRKYNLLKLNADGFMMTRSLAENYPYTFLYKAQLRGARESWLLLVEDLERENTSPIETLKFMISKLVNAAAFFEERADVLIASSKRASQHINNKNDVIIILARHSERSDYAARLLEVSMHSLMASAIDSGIYGGCEIKPLSQMRSANKKHGNIGDIEILEDDQIIESWDAKYGKGYLREEIEEAVEKLQYHPLVKTVGFVTTVDIERTNEIEKRIEEIQDLYDIEFLVISFEEWVDRIYALCNGIVSENELSIKWLETYCQYLAQKRRDIAPIDEPCLEWIETLIKIIEK